MIQTSICGQIRSAKSAILLVLSLRTKDLSSYHGKAQLHYPGIG